MDAFRTDIKKSIREAFSDPETCILENMELSSQVILGP